MMKSEKRFGKALIFAFMFLALVFASLECASATGTPPDEAWNETYSGTVDDEAYAVQQTTDGGYIIAGGTQQYDDGNSNVLLVKTKPNGDEEWQKTFGGPSIDYAYSVQQTSDGGYILTGKTKLSDAKGLDVWLLKTYSNGTLDWDKTFGGSDGDWAWSVNQTSDGGYIIAGGTYSYGAGWADVWLLKTNSNGTLDWYKTFGGADTSEEAYSVHQTSDGGYILAGRKESYGGGPWDAWLVKTNSDGTLDWDKTFGDTNADEGYSVQQTTDRGYILTGSTKSYGVGESDAWLLKTDSGGDELWNKTFGGASPDVAYSVQQTTDSGYILAGRTSSFGAGSYDFWLIKVRAEGEGNQSPTLSSGSVSPSTGDSTTTFNYNVTYTDSDGDAPTTKHVYIDDTQHTMTETSGSYTTGATFKYSTTLSAESHNYYFHFDDGHGHGTRLPASRTFSGPNVSGSNQIFDTGQGTYPSSPGTHEGEITPTDDLKVTKLYTYPCAGTGGHTESIDIREGSKLIARGTWDGYQSDWHNITLHNEANDDTYVTLLKDHKYNYVIRTGSYPQIIHAQNRTTDDGIIECTEFVDANGKRYDDWIPAIRLV